MSAAALLIRSARRDAGITQAELAERLGTTQSAIARIERPGSNPRLKTLEAALAAMGRRLELTARETVPHDDSLIAAHLAMTPLDRLRAHDQASEQLSGLMGRVEVLTHGG